MGSRRDNAFIKPLCSALKKLKLPFETRISSAHKTPHRLLQMLQNYENSGIGIVYITVAGRSNALSGFVDANTRYPVIACPPYSEKFSGMDIYSSLRMPSGVSPLVIINPENAALAAAKILALRNSEIYERILNHQQDMKSKIELDDDEYNARAYNG
ncbi:MAG: AIR carboxylase family protein [Candidatus Bathyarchaeota archaeon]|nr:MAG: AIR carboxylase family protein [Candidatus Bathyarchaeota archaeon]